ncbi:MAG: glycosyltransferase, partial [Actinobacteria bacterium]|nr:glycosyltransferase [Actinomycetota bacterium]
DGSADAVAAAFPDVQLIRSVDNMGAAGRTLGVQAARTPFVAFADDDSWWAPGALATAARCFAQAPRLGLLAARILVGPQERVDPACTAMRHSPLPARADLPGPSVLGFVACGSVVRRAVYLQVGGFSGLLFFAGEELLLAQDLATAGWGVAYVDGCADRCPRRCCAPSAWSPRSRGTPSPAAVWPRRYAGSPGCWRSAGRCRRRSRPATGCWTTCNGAPPRDVTFRETSL